MPDMLDQVFKFPFEDPPEAGDYIEIAEGVLWIRMPLPMRLDHVNCYAFDEGDSWTIVDTGFSTSKVRDMWDALLAGPMGGKPVSRVIGSHHHPDHIGLAGWLMAKDGAELWTSRTAWLQGRMMALDRQDKLPPEAEAYYRSCGMDEEIIEERRDQKQTWFSDMVWPLPLGYRRMVEGETIQLGGRNWDVHMGNGHAPEHVTLWCAEEPLVFTGDQVIPGISPNLGVFPTEPEADPVGEWLEACERLKAYATPEQMALPGHKRPFIGLPMRFDMLIENHHSALERLREHLAKEPARASDIFYTLYKREIGKGEYGLALVEARSHLNHLNRLGLVDREMDADGAWVWSLKG